MKKIFLSFLLFLTTTLYSQTVIQYDNMETYSPLYITAGWWTPAPTATWATNTSVSTNQSAVIYGLGNGTSGVEQDWYSLPNITGLNTSHPYQLKFRLCSQTFTNSTATTRGVDVADIVEVQVSTNGGVTYVSELRITGNNNAIFPYSPTGIINHNANGSFTNSVAPIGDVYQSPSGVSTTGPSTVVLNLPSGISQVAIDIFCRINSAGEEWWLDNIQLIEIFPLPVELLYFEGKPVSNTNYLYWSTASEHNSDYFEILHSVNGEDWESLGYVTSSGNSTIKNDYNFYHNTPEHVLNYYILKQVDYDGVFKTYNPIVIDNRIKDKKIIKYTNIFGQEVGPNETGVIFITYEDNSVIKTIK